MNVTVEKTAKIFLNFDGACKPVNPDGIASYGFVVRAGDGKILKKGSGVVGEGEGMTNNVAEYTAAIEGLKWVEANLDPGEVKLRGDSQLLIRQINGRYAVRSERIRPLYGDLKEVVEELGGDFEVEWVPRERNEEADALSKEAFEDYVRTHDYEFNGHPLIQCDECGAWMFVREGKYGIFYGCSRYPKCKNTKPIEEVDE